MPYRIRWEGHGVYRCFEGVITPAEFRQADMEMRRDVRYDEIRYIISDYLEARPSPDLTERDLRAHAEFERLHFYDSPDTVQAIVATDPQTVEYARCYESLGVSPYCVANFSTVAEARKWIASNPRLNRHRPPASFSAETTQPRG
jgi:hypothetical protein